MQFKLKPLALLGLCAWQATAATQTPNQFVKSNAGNVIVMQASQGKTLTPVLDLFSMGNNVGRYGAYSGDYNGDGNKELVLAQYNNVSIVQIKGGKFEPVSQFNFKVGVSSTAYFHDLKADGHYLFVASSDGKVSRINLITRTVETLTGIDSARTLLVAQTSDDSQPQLLVETSGGYIQVYDAVTGALQRTFSGISSNHLLAGSFTEKGVHELLLDNGQIYRFTSGWLTLQKTIASPIGTYSQVVDMDGDGLDEVVTSSGWTTISMISPATDSILWSHTPGQNISALQVFDLNGDGKLDVVYGDGQWGGSLHGLALTTGDEFWSLASSGYGVSSLVVADLDSDGKLDIGWGGSFSDNENYHVYDVASQTAKWVSKNVGFPVNAVGLADINGDGKLEALYANVISSSTVIKAVDPESKAQLWEATNPDNWGGTVILKTADLDKDGQPDIIVGDTKIDKPQLRVLNGKDGTERYSTLLGNGDAITDILPVDLDGDGYQELVVGNKTLSSMSAGTVFKVLNGRTGEVLKTSPSLGSDWNGLKGLTVFDLPETSALDIFGLMNGKVYSYDYANNIVKSYSFGTYFSALTAATINGEKTLLAGDNSGNLYQLGLDGSATALGKLCDSSFVDLKSASGGRLLYSCGSGFGEYDLDSQAQQFFKELSHVTSAPILSTLGGADFYMAGGDKVTVYSSAAASPLLQPAAQSFTTHVLKPLTETLQLDQDVDYVVLEGQPQYGRFSFTDRKTGTFTYQPNGTVGTEKVQFYAVKGASVSPLTDLTLDVTNQAPVADNLSVSTPWNTPVEITLPATDADQEPLAFKLYSQPAHGHVTLLDAATGKVSFVPGGDSMDAVSFSFSAKDSLDETEVKNVTITLTNQAPLAQALSYTSSYETPVNGRLKGTDADGDAISYELVSQPSAGKVSLESDTGLFTYQPAGEGDQKISFSYVAKDKFASSAPQTVSIDIKGKSKSGGGSLGFGALALLALAGLRRRH
ncbi:FG-GAP-like repeat-containing protein [Gallaecimonas kandeliae]|uniref:FG-GAP-like repeat-containing protein n=1 Tax=Gallaecimonas kandeliae TaxID=3029055 RepID=UPI00264936FC|nr:FG-GAP-like repeat-containing protein [Gallaecimonas kandeliae]WKE66229.1 FG-GAP-like repeat-containing protein [Gallaecimonas kandeliae]